MSLDPILSVLTALGVRADILEGMGWRTTSEMKISFVESSSRAQTLRKLVTLISAYAK